MLSVIDEYLSEHVTNVQLEYFHIELDELRVYFHQIRVGEYWKIVSLSFI